jgi:hypothetical protein
MDRQAFSHSLTRTDNGSGGAVQLGTQAVKTGRGGERHGPERITLSIIIHRRDLKFSLSPTRVGYLPKMLADQGGPPSTVRRMLAPACFFPCSFFSLSLHPSPSCVRNTSTAGQSLESVPRISPTGNVASPHSPGGMEYSMAGKALSARGTNGEEGRKTEKKEIKVRWRKR